MTHGDRERSNGHAPDVGIQGFLANRVYVVLMRQAGQYFVVVRGWLPGAKARAFERAEAAFRLGTPDGDQTAIAILRAAGFAVEPVE